jgi:gliding motility-associated transport system ATP-binding protein
MIRVERLTRRYGPTVAIDGLSFSVDRGEVVGFLGPNGAGKSTTMRILTGYLAADEGRAEVAGIEVARDAVGVRSRVGYLPETNPLYPDMQVAGFLEFVATIRGVERSRRRAAIDRAVQACGLRGMLGKSIAELSKGFRQRVGLAQALVHDPDLLILDEPTAGLDPNQVLEIRDLILRLGREKTVLLSTHVLQEVTAVCGRAIILARGRKVADGALAELARTDGPVRLQCAGLALEAAEAALVALPAVSVTSKASIDGRSRFELQAPGGDEACERIGAAIHACGGRISELHRQNETLEECFHRLTVGS